MDEHAPNLFMLLLQCTPAILVMKPLMHVNEKSLWWYCSDQLLFTCFSCTLYLVKKSHLFSMAVTEYTGSKKWILFKWNSQN